jgi:hypothetical protein
MIRIRGQHRVHSEMVRAWWISVPLLLAIFSPKSAFSYSLLTHEQVIDIVWKDELKPILLKRFPEATEEELKDAHAYAYGGCLLQDMGYYPLGNKFFSDLTHYVRSGDFVENLIHESTNLNEYAFALGALAHYASDNAGHPFINHAVALSFPKLRKKYGNSVTYADDPKAHIRVEFGFDMTQVAKNRYSSQSYHDFIGFQVSKPVLERTFVKTYDLPLEDVVHPVDRSIGTFRRAVSQFIPELTRVAIEAKRPEIAKEHPGVDQKHFRYMLSRSAYEREWGKDYSRPGFGTRVLAFILRWIPKIGPLKAFDFKIPTPETEDLYFKSVTKTVAVYREALHEVANGHLALANLDFDTSRRPHLGEYKLSDEAYARLLDDLAKRRFAEVQADLRGNILNYYSEGTHKNESCHKKRKAWQKTERELQELQTVTRTPVNAGDKTGLTAMRKSTSR